MSTEMNNGGLAFAKGDYVSRPCDSNQRIVKGADGMTLRDYFIAHAPTEPQPWFQPMMPPRPATPFAHQCLNSDDLRDWNNERLDYEPDACSPELRAYGVRPEAAQSGAHAWDKEHEKQRYVQWPAAWADAMLAAREAACAS